MTRSEETSAPSAGGGASSVSREAEERWQAWKAFSFEAYACYHDTIESIRWRHPGLTSYDIVERIDATKGTFAWHWGAANEVRESINSLNAWGVRLHEWRAWNHVVSSYDDEDKQWDILHHFLEPVAYYCMLQPSGFADRLALTAENLLHQANRRVFPDEPDQLAQDAQPDKRLRRSERRRQLGALGMRWSKFPAFQQALAVLDGDEYRRLTRNYRNLATHSFSPRFMLGDVCRAVRSIVPRKDMVRQNDGSYIYTEHATEKMVAYTMGCQQPLALAESYEANVAEYRRARNAINYFISLAEELCDQIDHMDVKGAGGVTPALRTVDMDVWPERLRE